MKQLLEAGVHFGHQTRRWNPKMRPFIFTARNGIHILDLQQTVTRLNEACKFITHLTANGESILFVGTKKQAQDAIKEEAQRSGQFFVNQRWLGGMLTNFQTIQLRIRYMKDLEARKERGEFERLPKKEAQHLQDELDRLERVLGGIRDMRRLPGAIFVIDTKKEHTAVAEATAWRFRCRAGRHQHRSRRDGLSDPGQRRRHPRRPAALHQDRRAALEGRRQRESQQQKDEGEGRATEAPITLEEFGAEPGSESAPESRQRPATPAAAAPARRQWRSRRRSQRPSPNSS